MLFIGSRIFNKILQLILVCTLGYMAISTVAKIATKEFDNPTEDVIKQYTQGSSLIDVITNEEDEDNEEEEETENLNNPDDNIPELPHHGIINNDLPHPEEKETRQIPPMPMYIDIAERHSWGMTDKSFELNLQAKCNEIEYDISTLPTVSVIISFHESEKLTHLLHTLHSIVKYTPAEVLKEIIMIADNSSKVEHQDVLENYANSVFPGLVKIHRSNKPLGLIRARQLGAELASAEVICSMDAHMEVQNRWIEPILQEIKNNRKTMVTPYLDWMKPQDDGTWLYEHGNSRYKTIWFWYNMFFTFGEIAREFKDTKDPTAPIMSSCSVGTIWAMDREFFHEVGGFDMGMNFWGGENIDLPLRVFLFGGTHVQLPCSHAAHLEEKGQRNYRVGHMKDTSLNYIRIVETWFPQEYKDVIYYYNPLWKTKDYGDISDRLKLKEKATYDFPYYMKHFYPELKAPELDGFGWGGLSNVGLSTSGKIGYCFCVYPNPNKITLDRCASAIPHNKLTNIGLKDSNHKLPCAGIDFATFRIMAKQCDVHESNPHAMGMFWSTEGELRIAGHMVQHRLASSHLTIANAVALQDTDKIDRVMHYENGLIQLYKKSSVRDYCVVAKSPETKPIISFTTCNASDPFQQWRFTYYTQKYRDFVSKINVAPEEGHEQYYSDLSTFLDSHSNGNT